VRGGKDGGKALAEDAALLGIELPTQDENEDTRFPVEPENWDAVLLFMGCRSQWQYGPLGGMIGLRYEGVKALLDVAFPKRRRGEIMAAIQIMEWAVLEIMNSKK
jgi:hypothetical protein